MAVKYILFAVISIFLTTNCFPQKIGYAGKQIETLQSAIDKYRQIDSEWFQFSCDSCLYPGDKSNYVLLLRHNLKLTGDIPDTTSSSSIEMDSTLVSAIKKFQRRNGLKEDGIIGSKTTEALNVTPKQRIIQMEYSMRKWKSIPDTLEEPYLIVNIPDFKLYLIEGAEIKKEYKVIVGRLLNPTPELQSAISEIVINPKWIIPESIAKKEIIPMIQKDSGYINRNHLNVYTYSKGVKQLIRHDTINWKNVRTEKITYFFEQSSGSWNALGKIKFNFRNNHLVYLHDTPEKYLFAHPTRTYSHGCIRVENPQDLVKYLLNKNEYNTDSINFLLQNQTEHLPIPLKKSLPIIITYITSWVNSNGELQFRRDIYQKESDLVP